MGRGTWPAQSPTLTTKDILMFGDLNNMVYTTCIFTLCAMIQSDLLAYYIIH